MFKAFSFKSFRAEEAEKVKQKKRLWEIDTQLRKNLMFDEFFSIITKLMGNPECYRDIIMDLYLYSEPYLSLHRKHEVALYQQIIASLEQEAAQYTQLLKHHDDSMTAIVQNHEEKRQVNPLLPNPVEQISPHTINAMPVKMDDIRASLDRLQLVIRSTREVMQAAEAAAKESLSELTRFDDLARKCKEELIAKALALENEDGVLNGLVQGLDTDIERRRKRTNKLISAEEEILGNLAGRDDSISKELREEHLAKIARYNQELEKATTPLETQKKQYCTQRAEKQAEAAALRKQVEQQFPSDAALFYLLYHYRGAQCRRTLVGDVAHAIESLFMKFDKRNGKPILKLPEGSNISEANLDFTSLLYAAYTSFNNLVLANNRLHDIYDGRQDNVVATHTQEGRRSSVEKLKIFNSAATSTNDQGEMPGIQQSFTSDTVETKLEVITNAFELGCEPILTELIGCLEEMHRNYSIANRGQSPDYNPFADPLIKLEKFRDKFKSYCAFVYGQKDDPAQLGNDLYLLAKQLSDSIGKTVNSLSRSEERALIPAPSPKTSQQNNDDDDNDDDDDDHEKSKASSARSATSLST